MTIKTAPANLTEAQARSMRNGGRDVRAVLVNGQVVGLYAKNKYGVYIGTFDPEALTAEQNPFVATRPGFLPKPAARTLRRTVKDLVHDIAYQVPSNG